MSEKNFDAGRALRDLRVDREFAETMALRLRRGEREIVAAKASALDAIGSATDRGVSGLEKLKSAVNAYVSPDLISAAASLSQFAKMAGELEPVLAEAEQKGWVAWSQESPDAARAIMDFVAEFARARGVAMAAVESDEKALAGFKAIEAAAEAMAAQKRGGG
ncbi:hypothetical protein ACMX25_12330 [Caballeronia sp. 15715]|uniref:hypothetical protein n=1 Tax=Caballeronia sp. 15715 TaxID=3391030 RepID=UPI0039E6CF02